MPRLLEQPMGLSEAEADSISSALASANSTISSLQTWQSSANTTITTLQGQVSTANGTITTLQTQLTTASGNVTTLQSGLTTANTNISALQTSLTSANASIATLQSQVAALMIARAFQNAPLPLSGRAIVTTAAAANGWQIDATRDAHVTYSVSIASFVQIGVITSVGGYVVMEMSATNSSTAGNWTEVARVTNSQTIGLAVALSLAQTIAGCLAAMIPAGWFVRLRSVNTAGTPTYTLLSGQEVKL